MAYIKINLRSRLTDETGKAITTTISRFESDLPMVSTYEMNLIWHALAIRGAVEAAYLRVSPNVVWLTPDMLSGEFNIRSNVAWKID